MGELDRMIRRIALRDARRLVSQGYPPDVAATLATPGAWAGFRLEIVMQLCAEAEGEEAETGKPPDPSSYLPSILSERDVTKRC